MARLAKFLFVAVGVCRIQAIRNAVGDAGEADFAQLQQQRLWANVAARGLDLEDWQSAWQKNAAEAQEDGQFFSLMEGEAEAPRRGNRAPLWLKDWNSKLGNTAKPLGKGAFGTVYGAKLACNGQPVAIKQMRAKAREVEEEASVMKAFTGHAHFVSYFAHGKGVDQAYYILMESASGGTLGKVIESKVSTADRLQLFLDMLEGVAEMHQHSIVHRDLKPANVLVSRKCGGEEPCHAKVADLGLACHDGPSSVSGIPPCRGIAGTPIYIAPESWRNEQPHPKNDVWAMGLMLYELIFGDLPRKLATAPSMKALQTAIVGFKITDDSNYKKMPDGSAKTLLKGMISQTRRMSANDAIALARGMVDHPTTDVAAELPECWFNKAAPAPVAPAKPQKPAVTPASAPDANDDIDEDGDVDFFTIKNAKTNIATNFLLNPSIVDQTTGVVVADNAKLDQLSKSGYFKTPLRHGDRILELNDKSWAKLGYDMKMLLKDGGMGNSLYVKYQVHS
eukprot:gb/GFBE01059621.1/.p1 GENE.gb/GFBE01059621.1/~~gb/GFBE01059621.1/.p1  ORF type:complete len:507 (+),score=122.54 gb/GFBE01059621.1/:1-1521(+)